MFIKFTFSWKKIAEVEIIKIIDNPTNMEYAIPTFIIFKAWEKKTKLSKKNIILAKKNREK